MKHMTQWMVAPAMVLTLWAGRSAASVVDLRTMASDQGSLLHQYTFEGDATERLQDSAGAADLQGVTYGSQGSVAALAYPAGWDATTTAFTSQRLSDTGGDGGAYLRSTSTVGLGSTVTVEGLFRPQNLESGATIGYGVAHSPAGNRAYFMTEVAQTGDDQLATVVGDSFTQSDNRRPVVNPFVPGHWYYVANTYQLGGSNTLVSSYVADLTAGQKTVTQVLDNVTASGSFVGTNYLGIGGFSSSAQQAWAGSLDEVAIYGSTLSQAAVQSHLDALVATSNTAAMRQAVADTPGLVHHYTFEGDATERLQDKVTSGAAHLTELSYGSGSTSALDYSLGMDPTTQALTTQRISRSGGGAYLRTSASFSLGDTVTVEGLFQPENLESGGEIGYGVSHHGYPDRAYFVTIDEQSGDDSLATVIGDSFTAADNRQQIVNPFVPGHWYYVANTYEFDGSDTIVNTYVADLTAGDMVLTHVSQNVVASGSFVGSSRLGIGGFGSGLGEAWAGSLDEIAVYDRLLRADELQWHLNTLRGVPEPSAALLLLIGAILAGIAPLGRRARRGP